MSHVLLTGASGFLGASLRDTLRARGHVVTGTAHHAAEPDLVVCDLRDHDRVHRVMIEANPDVVIHCAALSSVVSNKTIDYYATNVVGTENVLSAIRQLDKRVRLVFTSTAGVYGNQNTSVLSETLPALPVHHYGLSKLACEQMIRNLANAIDFTIVRPFNIIGVGQAKSFIVPKVMSALVRGQRVLDLGNIDVERDYIEVSTACAIIADLMENSASVGETVNLCSGEGTPLRHLIEIAQELAGYEIEVRRNPAFVRADEVWRLVGDRGKLDRLLGRPPHFRPLRDALQDMLRAYRAGDGMAS